MRIRILEVPEWHKKLVEQERQKQEMQAKEAREAFAQLSPEEQVAVMQQIQAQQQGQPSPEEQAMMEQQAMQEQGMGQPQMSPEEQAMMEQQMAMQGGGQSMMGGAPPMGIDAAIAQQAMAQPMMAYGGRLNVGNKFAFGGDKKQEGENDSLMQYLKSRYPKVSSVFLADLGKLMKAKARSNPRIYNYNYSDGTFEYFKVLDSIVGDQSEQSIYNNLRRAGIPEKSAASIALGVDDSQNDNLKVWNARRVDLDDQYRASTQDTPFAGSFTVPKRSVIGRAMEGTVGQQSNGNNRGQQGLSAEDIARANGYSEEQIQRSLAEAANADLLYGDPPFDPLLKNQSFGEDTTQTNTSDNSLETWIRRYHNNVSDNAVHALAVAMSNYARSNPEESGWNDEKSTFFANNVWNSIFSPSGNGVKEGEIINTLTSLGMSPESANSIASAMTSNRPGLDIKADRLIDKIGLDNIKSWLLENPWKDKKLDGLHKDGIERIAKALSRLTAKNFNIDQIDRDNYESILSSTWNYYHPGFVRSNTGDKENFNAWKEAGLNDTQAFYVVFGNRPSSHTVHWDTNYKKYVGKDFSTREYYMAMDESKPSGVTNQGQQMQGEASSGGNTGEVNSPSVGYDRGRIPDSDDQKVADVIHYLYPGFSIPENAGLAKSVMNTLTSLGLTSNLRNRNIQGFASDIKTALSSLYDTDAEARSLMNKGVSENYSNDATLPGTPAFNEQRRKGQSGGANPAAGRISQQSSVANSARSSQPLSMSTAPQSNRSNRQQRGNKGQQAPEYNKDELVAAGYNHNSEIFPEFAARNNVAGFTPETLFDSPEYRERLRNIMKVDYNDYAYILSDPTLTQEQKDEKIRQSVEDRQSKEMAQLFTEAYSNPQLAIQNGSDSTGDVVSYIDTIPSSVSSASIPYRTAASNSGSQTGVPASADTYSTTPAAASAVATGDGSVGQRVPTVSTPAGVASPGNTVVGIPGDYGAESVVVKPRRRTKAQMKADRKKAEKYNEEWFLNRAKELGMVPQEATTIDRFKYSPDNPDANLANFNNLYREWQRQQAYDTHIKGSRASKKNKLFDPVHGLYRYSDDGKNIYQARISNSDYQWVNADGEYITNDDYNNRSDEEKAKFKRANIKKGDRLFDYDGNIVWDAYEGTLDDILNGYNEEYEGDFKWKPEDASKLDYPAEMPHSKLQDLRYAPPVISGINLLQNLFNSPDYGRADSLIALANSYRPMMVSPEPVYSGYKYTPRSPWELVNAGNAITAGLNRNLLNSGLTAGGTAANMITGAYKGILGMGENYQKINDYNDKMRLAKAEFDLKPQQINAANDLQAQIQNQQALYNAAQHRYLGLNAGNTMKNGIDALRNASIAANWDSLGKSLGNIGEEELTKDMLAWLENTGVLKSDVFKSRGSSTSKYGGMLTKRSNRGGMR